jgi:hypothetical protein
MILPLLIIDFCDKTKGISAALDVNIMADVLDSTPYGPESDGVSQWLLLQFLILVSKVVPYVERTVSW